MTFEYVTGRKSGEGLEQISFYNCSCGSRLMNYLDYNIPSTKYWNRANPSENGESVTFYFKCCGLFHRRPLFRRDWFTFWASVRFLWATFCVVPGWLRPPHPLTRGRCLNWFQKMGSASNTLDRPNNITITRCGISKRKHVPLSWQPQMPGHSLSLTTETTKCSHEDDKRVMSLYDQMGPTWKQIPDTGLQPFTAKYHWQGAKQRRVDSPLAAASSARTAHWASLSSWRASWSSLPKKGKCKTNKQFKKL